MEKIRTLSLRNLNYELDLVKEDRYHIYYNAERNVGILAIPYCKNDSIQSIFDGISDDAYFRLIDFMNKNENLLINWTKTEGTTSDYTIYCDFDYKNSDYWNGWNIIDVQEYLWTLDLGEIYTCKYNIVKNKKIKHFKNGYFDRKCYAVYKVDITECVDNIVCAAEPVLICDDLDDLNEVEEYFLEECEDYGTYYIMEVEHGEVQKIKEMGFFNDDGLFFDSAEWDFRVIASIAFGKDFK